MKLIKKLVTFFLITLVLISQGLTTQAYGIQMPVFLKIFIEHPHFAALSKYADAGIRY